MMNSENYPDIFEPFDDLIEIEILGETYQIPENNALLRGFQFPAMENIPHGDFCRNDDCANCQVWLTDGAAEKIVLACRAKVVEEVKIVQLNPQIKLRNQPF
ncbi:MAG: hypothetical protein M3T96_04310 [Acidobacteriota bacterium]|nr:hypothetical protein [Acidobacteriota bacterium]